MPNHPSRLPLVLSLALFVISASAFGPAVFRFFWPKSPGTPARDTAKHFSLALTADEIDRK